MKESNIIVLKAVAMDFTFHDTDHVYGIPEHADKFSLQDTSNSDPYRLYNLDVFEYELWNPMALYAAIPFMVRPQPIVILINILN